MYVLTSDVRTALQDVAHDQKAHEDHVCLQADDVERRMLCSSILQRRMSSSAPASGNFVSKERPASLCQRAVAWIFS